MGIARSDYNRPFNPVDALRYNPLDADGWHYDRTRRAGEFALYDEYDPLRKITLNADGTANKTDAGGFEWFLNFSTEEGTYVPAGTNPKPVGQTPEGYPEAWTDGNDRIFGDTGNDWLVGGTGRDDLYGGFGNDLLNADDNHATNLLRNDQPDTQPSYEDRAYGGGGRDVLIANTGGDRLIDWVGEFNSYLVPFAPFGMATVSRTLQPQLAEFLYALSASDGADPTRSADTGADAFRNGEPEGELGVVRQKDFAWQTQTGAPADPQAGNIPGGKRDVLRTANFNSGTADGFAPDSGTWSVTGGRYQVAPEALGGDAASVFFVDRYIPTYFEMTATIRAVKPTAGYKANAYLIFDYQSPTDFKFAGVNVSTNKLEMGYRDASGWNVVVQKPYTTALKADTDYNVFLALNGNTATLIVNNRVTLTYTFAPRTDADGFTYFLQEGMVGLGANNAKGQIDNVTVQRIPPEVTLDRTVDFLDDLTDLFELPASGAWDLTESRYHGVAPSGGTAIDLLTLDVAPASYVHLSATLNTAAQGGFVFDYYGPEDFKFVTLSVETKQILLGHHTLKAGWVIDAALTNTGLNSTTDYTLELTLKGTTVSVMLDNQAGLSYAYNALVTDGGFGLLVRNGQASFDRVNVKTDDPQFAQPAVPLVSVSDASLAEGNTGTTTATLNFSLSEAAQVPVTVDYATINGTATAGSDYQTATGTVTFAVGQVTAQVIFTVLGDLILEPDETFRVQLSNPVGAQISDGTGEVTILNDEALPLPTLSIMDVSVTEGRAGKTTNATVRITLSSPSTTPVTVKLATINGTATSGADYGAVAGATITFDPGVTSKSYTLGIYGDNLQEGDEQSTVQLSNPTNAAIADGTGVVTIIDDDAAKLLAATSGGSTAVLSCDALAPIVDEAIARWEALLGARSILLRRVSVRIADLPGLALGEALGTHTILLDTSAAGNGWFIDPTPADDSEFTAGTIPAGMDLLTVVMHEFGHVLGLTDLASGTDVTDVMYETLSAGTRRTETRSTVMNETILRVDGWYHSAMPQSGSWHDDWLKELGFLT